MQTYHIMLILLVAHFLSAPALPVLAVNDERNGSSCDNINTCRTLLGIIWSCVTTILLCTWVAIHPNIPQPVDTRRMWFWRRCIHKLSCFFGNKVLMFICALLIPEFILVWAIRQHLMARKIVKENGT
jgi:hypothetical protein